MVINNINGVIDKDLGLFPSDIKLAWKAKRKHRELTKNQLFLFLCFFFLKILDIRKPKTPIFKKGSYKKFLGQVLNIFQTSPMACYTC